MRLFIAIDIPEEIKNYFRELQERLPEAKMRKTSDFHLTLKFLGSVDGNKKKEIEEALKKISFQFFEAKLSKIGAFGSKNFPRVIWVGIDVPAWLSDEQKKLEELLEPLGFEKENRFSPHVTLARVKFVQNPDIFHKKLSEIQLEPKTFPVNGFYLFESKLGREGAVYSRLEKFP